MVMTPVFFLNLTETLSVPIFRIFWETLQHQITLKFLNIQLTKKWDSEKKFVSFLFLEVQWKYRKIWKIKRKNRKSTEFSQKFQKIFKKSKKKSPKKSTEFLKKLQKIHKILNNLQICHYSKIIYMRNEFPLIAKLLKIPLKTEKIKNWSLKLNIEIKNRQIAIMISKIINHWKIKKHPWNWFKKLKTEIKKKKKIFSQFSLFFLLIILSEFITETLKKILKN